MRRSIRLVPVVLVALVFAACGQGSGDTLLAPDQPSLNTGWGIGSNATGGGTTSSGETESTTTSTTSTDVAPTDSTSRGSGWGIGSN